MPTVWGRTLGQFVRRAEATGLSRGRLLERAGLCESELARLDARLPLEKLYALIEGVDELSEDPFVHLRMSRAFELDSLEALAFLVITSATLAEGMRAMIRYQDLWSDGERYELEETRDGAHLVYRPWGPPRDGHRIMAEMFAVDVLVNASAMTGGPFEACRASFRHAAPDDRETCLHLLGTKDVTFDAPRDEVWISHVDLERRLAPNGYESLRAFFEAQVQDRLRSLAVEHVAERVREVLMRQQELVPTLAALARALSMSPRTVQRRLADEGTSLRAVADSVRRLRAIPMLENGRSIAEIAYTLGYAERSAFHRAFRRWTGRTPESFRR